jgi:hypothetical protein
VNRLAETWRPGESEVLSDFPAFEPRPDFALRVAATFTPDALLPALRFWLKELEIDGRVELAPYGQMVQSLLDPASLLNAPGRGVSVLLLRVRDWLRELPDDQVNDIDFLRADLQDTARDLERALRAHRVRQVSDTLLIVCPSYGAKSSAENIPVRQTEADIAASLRGVAGLRVVAASEYHPHYTVNEDQIHDELRDDIATGTSTCRSSRRSWRVMSIDDSRRRGRLSWSIATTRCGRALSERWVPTVSSSTKSIVRCTNV